MVIRRDKGGEIRFRNTLHLLLNWPRGAVGWLIQKRGIPELRRTHFSCALQGPQETEAVVVFTDDSIGSTSSRPRPWRVIERVLPEHPTLSSFNGDRLKFPGGFRQCAHQSHGSRQ